MKTIFPPDNFLFEECIVMLGKCLFVVYKKENDQHITRLYDPVSETYVTPICKYTAEDNVNLEFQGRIFKHIKFRPNYYDPFHPLITYDGKLIFGLPFYSLNEVTEVTREKQLAFDPFTTEKLITETKIVNNLNYLVSAKTRLFHDSKNKVIAFLSRLKGYGRDYFDYGFNCLDIQVISYIAKYDFKELPSNELFLLQLNHSIEPKIFKLDFDPNSIKLHPTDPLILAYNSKNCTIIDLEI